MDMGELFKREVRILPCNGGTFMVNARATCDGEVAKSWGFTRLSDLMRFLHGHAEARLALDMQTKTASEAMESEGPCGGRGMESEEP